MLDQYKTKTNLGVGVGLIALIIGRELMQPPLGDSPERGLLVAVLGALVFVWGCTQYAKGKGHSGWWGLCGLFSLLGLLVLFFLPDRHKADKLPKA